MDVWQVDRLRPEPSRPEILRSDDGAARVIALALRRDELLNEHQVHEHTWLMVLDGALEITSGSDRQEVSRGCIVHLDPAERRAVRATSDSSILYLLAPWPGPGHPSFGRGDEGA
jgi:quercetin dioxygenase-like cupin family protein